MNIAMFLTVISLILGLIGSFTETTKKIRGVKIPTFWGYLLAILLIASAAVAIFADLKNEKEYEEKAKLQKSEGSQDRLLSLIAVSSNFDLAYNPNLVLDYLNVNESDTTLQRFPGFGLPGINYELQLNLSEAKSAAISGSEASISIAQGDIVALKDVKSDVLSKQIEEESGPAQLKIHVTKEEINDEFAYLFELVGYSTLLEFLLDFQDNRDVGTLAFKKKGANFKDLEWQHIDKYIRKRGKWHINLYVTSSADSSNFISMFVPVILSSPEVIGEVVMYKLTTGRPRLNKLQESPI